LKKAAYTAIFICLLLCFTGCGANNVSGNIADIESGKETTERLFQQTEGAENIVQTETQINEPYTTDTKIAEVISDPVFGEHGKLIFPVDSGYYSGNTLGTLRLTWYSNIDPEKTVEIANYLREHAAAGETYFYDIYTDEEKAVDPAKQDTGLFFFKGNPGEKFAVCNAGGGFAYVGAMQDSFPHALELSKMGYNAFALIYRPGAVIMQYTGHNDYTESDPPTFVCVGENDGIAGWRTMKNRLRNLDALGIPTEFHKYPGLGHGFGIGTGTVAEGWISEAVAFWEIQIKNQS